MRNHHRSSVLLWIAAALLLVTGALLGYPSAKATKEAGFANPPAPATMAEQAMGGSRGPFYPSALSTRDGGLLPASAFPAPQSCGRSGCHPDIVAEWSSSAHRFSGLDNPWYRSTYEEMEKTVGKIPARWCAGCHTPALLASGLLARATAEVTATRTATSGVSCTVCHAVSHVKSSLGQADYELDVKLDRMTTSTSSLVRGLSGLLVRIDPGRHRRTYGKPLLAHAELCSTCHKAYTDQPVNGERFNSVMDDYGPWQKASASGQSMTQSIYFPPPQECADCHMPTEPSNDAGGRRGRIHSHRFAAANTALPAWRGDERQLRTVAENLKANRISVDIFAMSKGSPIDAEGMKEERIKTLYAPLNRLPATLRRGESTRFDILLRSRGIGHLFPGGKDVFQDCWIEFKAVDDRGRTVFWSGGLAADGSVDPGAHVLGGLWVDKDGKRVEGYDVWNNRTDIYTQPVQPDSGYVVHFRVDVPVDAGNALTLTARLYYRKFRPDFTRQAFTRLGLAVPQLPIITMAESSITLPLVAPGAALPDMEHPDLKPAIDVERWNDYAFGLADRRDYLLSFKAFDALLRIKPDYADGWTTLGNLDWAVGDMAEARAHLKQALALQPGLPRAEYYLGLVDQKETDYPHALEHLRAAAAAYPREALIWKEVGRTLFVSGAYRDAVEALDRAVAIDPEEPTVHFMLAMAHRALGHPDLSARHQQLYERFNYHLSDQEMAAAYLRKNPHANAERQPLHEHLSAPLDEPGAKVSHEQKGDSR